jgi:hypothetical protein
MRGVLISFNHGCFTHKKTLSSRAWSDGASTLDLMRPLACFLAQRTHAEELFALQELYFIVIEAWDVIGGSVR